LDVTLFCVPDDYATGREPFVARRLFPQVRIVPSRDYLRFALGAPLDGLPSSVDDVLYLGGDLMHAGRVNDRLGGRLRSYKFARRSLRERLTSVYAVDAANRRDILAATIPPERIELVGNLAIDGALGEASGRFGSGAPRTPARDWKDGVLIMPGSRRLEIANLVPFFLQAAVRMRALAPELPIAFGISPFTELGELERALAGGGDPRLWGTRGRVVDTPGGPALQPLGDAPPFPIVHDAMRAASRARVALTIPGTKCIELAALGVPTVVCTPYNAPELAVVNGPLQYLGRIPLAGTALKRAVVMRVAARFPLTAQPNIDAGEMLMPELRGTLTPGRVAARTLEYAGDDVARANARERLTALYREHVGASERMARSLLRARAGAVR
jgi:lipid-A-disaccharide synthase